MELENINSINIYKIISILENIKDNEFAYDIIGELKELIQFNSSFRIEILKSLFDRIKLINNKELNNYINIFY